MSADDEEEPPVIVSRWDPVKLTLRVGRGEQTKRGAFKVCTYETVIMSRDLHGRSIFPPYSIFKTSEDYIHLRDTFKVLNRTGGTIRAAFPRAVEPRNEESLSEAEQLERVTLFGNWTMELLDVFSKLPKGQKIGAAKTIFLFFDVAEGNKMDKFVEVIEAKECIREKMMNGALATTAAPVDGRLVKCAKKVSHKPKTRFQAWSEQTITADVFERRFNSTDGSIYMFNPFSGEIITDFAEDINRHKSHWRPPDPFPERAPKEAQVQRLFPCFFAGRGIVRAFGGWGGDRQLAARALTSAARGLIARARLRRRLEATFVKVLDKHTQHYFFFDKSTGVASWTKPRLAGPFCIKVEAPDLRNDTRTVEAAYCDGPVHRSKLGKGRLSRYRQPGPPEQPPISAREPEVPNLDSTPFRIMQLWIDENLGQLELYAPLKECMQEEDWYTLVEVAEARPDDALCQMVCAHAFGRMPIGPGLEEVCFPDAARTIGFLVASLEISHAKHLYGCNQQLFIGTALLCMLQKHPCRKKFFSTAHLDEEAQEGLSGAAEAYIERRMLVFVKMLRSIPVEVAWVQGEKGYQKGVAGKARVQIAVPTPRAVEMVEAILQIVGALLHERETREVVAERTAPFVVHALRVCNSEPFVLQYGLRCLYNSAFMSPVGWECLTYRTEAAKLVDEIRQGPLGGDDEVLKDLRRVELALEPEGWGGNVERQIEEEMKAAKAEFLMVSAPQPSNENSPAASPGQSQRSPLSPGSSSPLAPPMRAASKKAVTFASSPGPSPSREHGDDSAHDPRTPASLFALSDRPVTSSVAQLTQSPLLS